MASDRNVIHKVLAAEEFQLFDSKGVLRAMLSTRDSDGFPQMEFYDDSHCGRISLGLDPAGNPHAGLLRKDGSCAIGIGIDSGGQGGLAVYNSGGECILRIRVDPDETPMVEVVSEQGVRRWPP